MDLADSGMVEYSQANGGRTLGNVATETSEVSPLLDLKPQQLRDKHLKKRDDLFQ